VAARRTDELFQLIDLGPLALDLCLLFFDGVDKDDRETIVLNAFDFAVLVADYEQRVDRGDIFSSETQVT
jgi:hypothetical protein